MNGQLAGNRLKDIMQWAEQRLQDWEERERKATVRWMIQSLLQLSTTELLIDTESTFSESEILKIHFAIKRLLQGEPLQYVLNEAFFAGMVFQLNQSVLIPRPETEEWLMESLPLIQKEDHVLDLGTGSGCIAITIAIKSKAQVTALDLSEKALVVAKANAEKYNAQVEFVHADMRNAGQWIALANVIISNPPYVLEKDKAEMQEQVLNHEPHMALFVPNESPLLFYQSIVEQVNTYGENCRMIIFETHEKFAHDVAELFDSNLWAVQVKKDLQKKERAVIAQKK